MNNAEISANIQHDWATMHFWGPRCLAGSLALNMTTQSRNGWNSSCKNPLTVRYRVYWMLNKNVKKSRNFQSSLTSTQYTFSVALLRLMKFNSIAMGNNRNGNLSSESIRWKGNGHYILWFDILCCPSGQIGSCHYRKKSHNGSKECAIQSRQYTVTHKSHIVRKKLEELQL